MKNYGPCPICGNPIQKSHRVTCSWECGVEKRARASHGCNNPDWKGGRYIEPEKGYVMIRKPSHHRARMNGYVLEHILVMEELLGRPLNEKEVVHHLNHNPSDNRPENLVLHPSNAEHLRECGHHRAKSPPCKCGRPATSRGMCERCYAYWRRTGTIRPPVDYDGRIHPLSCF